MFMNNRSVFPAERLFCILKFLLVLTRQPESVIINANFLLQGAGSDEIGTTERSEGEARAAARITWFVVDKYSLETKLFLCKV